MTIRITRWLYDTTKNNATSSRAWLGSGKKENMSYEFGVITEVFLKNNTVDAEVAQRLREGHTSALRQYNQTKDDSRSTYERESENLDKRQPWISFGSQDESEIVERKRVLFAQHMERSNAAAQYFIHERESAFAFALSI